MILLDAGIWPFSCWNINLSIFIVLIFRNLNDASSFVWNIKRDIMPMTSNFFLLFITHFILLWVIYNNIDSFHHDLCVIIIYPVSLVVDNSFVTFRIYLAYLLSINKNITLTTKNMEIFDIWLPSFPQLIVSNFGSWLNGYSVLDVSGCIHSFIP